MKKILSIIVVFFILLPMFTSVTEASTFREVKKTQIATQLRVSASPSASAVATLPKGTLVTQFSTVKGGWSYIQANNKKGYVATSALITPSSSIKIAGSKSGLVVKETASTKAKTVATLKYNMIVEDFGTAGAGWSFVQYGNVTGYVNSNFISVTKPTKKYTNVGVSLRNIASPSGKITGSLIKNAEVSVHSQIAGWSYITSGSLRGYVPSTQLSATKQQTIAQTLKTFTHLRPTNISWMEYYFEMIDEPKGVLSGYVYKSSYDNESNYEVPYAHMSYSPAGFMMGLPESDWIWITLEAPLVQNKAIPTYDYDGNYNEFQIGNAYLRSTNETLKTPAGTFNNVVHIEEKFFSTSVSAHYYFAPGYGLLKIRDSNNKVFFELRDFY